MKTLEQLLKQEKQARRVEKGVFGIEACKENIKDRQRYANKSYYLQLEEYVNRANTETFFNNRMILACWELINEK